MGPTSEILPSFFEFCTNNAHEWNALFLFVWIHLWRETSKYVQKALSEMPLMGNKFQNDTRCILLKCADSRVETIGVCALLTLINNETAGNAIPACIFVQIIFIFVWLAELAIPPRYSAYALGIQCGAL
jgi:hypothetical protein